MLWKSHDISSREQCPYWEYPDPGTMYRTISPPILDGRFNPISVRDDDVWIVLGFRHMKRMMSFREISYTLIDENIAYFSPSSVYRIIKKNHLTQKLIRPYTSEQNDVDDRVNQTMRKSLVPVVLTDCEQTKTKVSRIVEHYNNERRHSSLNYLTLKQYYIGNPEELIRIREHKIESAKILRRRNVKKRNVEVKLQKLYHNSFRDMYRNARNITFSYRY